MGVSIGISLTLFVAGVAVISPSSSGSASTPRRSRRTTSSFQLRDAVTVRIVRDFTNSMSVPLSATTNAAFLIQKQWMGITDFMAGATHMYKHLTLLRTTSRPRR